MCREWPRLSYHSKCRQCYNAYMAEYMLKRYHRNRLSAIDQLGGKCEVCGTTENLEIDHIDRSKKEFDLAALFTQGKDRIQRELSKCQVLCQADHKRKTSREMSVSHGEGLTGKKNCSCIPCKARKAEYMRNYRKKLRSGAGNGHGCNF